MADDEQRRLLADRTPFPDDLDERLREQFTFLVEVDQLKAIMRQSPLVAVPRRENDAEHSWHLAMMVVLLAEHSDEPIDVGQRTCPEGRDRRRLHEPVARRPTPHRRRRGTRLVPKR